jgi:hypothetical protein
MRTFSERPAMVVLTLSLDWSSNQNPAMTDPLSRRSFAELMQQNGIIAQLKDQLTEEVLTQENQGLVNFDGSFLSKDSWIKPVPA